MLDQQTYIGSELKIKNELLVILGRCNNLLIKSTISNLIYFKIIKS